MPVLGEQGKSRSVRSVCVSVLERDQRCDEFVRTGWFVVCARC